jgi:hypothetical protein
MKDIIESYEKLFGMVGIQVCYVTMENQTKFLSIDRFLENLCSLRRRLIPKCQIQSENSRHIWTTRKGTLEVIGTSRGISERDKEPWAYLSKAGWTKSDWFC